MGNSFVMAVSGNPRLSVHSQSSHDAQIEGDGVPGPCPKENPEACPCIPKGLPSEAHMRIGIACSPLYPKRLVPERALIREPLDILRLLPPARAGMDSLRTKRKPAASAPPGLRGNGLLPRGLPASRKSLKRIGEAWRGKGKLSLESFPFPLQLS